MVAPARTLLLALTLTLPSCYLAHGRSSEPPERPDAGRAVRRDAGRPAPLSDGGREPPARDAGPPLPPEPDPDLGPGTRPSEYPDAEEWTEPPPLGEDDPCCELDEPVRVLSREDGVVVAYERPSLAWGPGRWGLLAMQVFAERDWNEHDPRGVVVELAADGRPLGPHVELEPPATRGVIRYAEGRWAIGLWTDEGATGGWRDIAARLYDRDLRPASEWETLGNGGRFDLARLTHGDRWVGVIERRSTIVVAPFGDDGADASLEQPAPSPIDLRAVGLRSRAAVLFAMGLEAPAPNVVRVVGGPPDYAELGLVTLGSRYGVDAAAIAALRDLALVVGIERGRARVEVVDPFAIALTAAARTLGAATELEYSGIIDVAASSKLGLAGVCWGVGGRGGPGEGPAGVDFRVLGPDGAPRGRSVRIVESAFRASMPNCAVGSDDEGFLVAWRDADALWVRRVSVPR